MEFDKIIQKHTKIEQQIVDSVCQMLLIYEIGQISIICSLFDVLQYNAWSHIPSLVYHLLDKDTKTFHKIVAYLYSWDNEDKVPEKNKKHYHRNRANFLKNTEVYFKKSISGYSLEYWKTLDTQKKVKTTENKKHDYNIPGTDIFFDEEEQLVIVWNNSYPIHKAPIVASERRKGAIYKILFCMASTKTDKLTNGDYSLTNACAKYKEKFWWSKNKLTKYNSYISDVNKTLSAAGSEYILKVVTKERERKLEPK